MRLKRATRSFARSSSGKKAVWLFVLLIGFMLSINGLNVLNSYVGRDFISAIENKDAPRFARQAWLFVGVFGLSTIAAVMYRYAEERLGLLWRDWQTRQLLDRYLEHRVYYQLQETGELENPDQRIAEDVRAFTTTTMSFVLMSLNALFTVVAFSGVLWAISPRLFFVAVGYALEGSLIAVLLGKKLVGLNDQQLDREANFRSELMHVRENAESVALLNREGRLRERLVRRLDELVANTRRMVSVNRNLGFFSTGYNYLIQIMPALIVAPLFMKGRMEFGVVTQSAMAFAQLMGAFSLIVTQIQSISSYAAVTARLGRLVDAMEAACTGERSPIRMVEDGDRLTFEKLTLFREDGRCLLRELSLTIDPGTRVLFASHSGHAKAALFKAAAGLYCAGEGKIIRPSPASLLFLPERPYLPKGTLREILLRAEAAAPVPDETMMTVLRKLNLTQLVEQVGGLEIERDWDDLLPVNEQASLALARILLARPRFVFLDRLSLTMDPRQVTQLYELLDEAGITWLVLGKPGDSPHLFDAVVTIEADGAWTMR